MSLYKKLLEIQTAVTAFTKDGSTNNYKYTSGDQVLNKIRPLMNEKGILLKQEVIDIENSRQDYTTSKGNAKVEVLTKALMKFTWVDVETGEKDENLFGANGFNDWEKGLGSALTYAERYFLLKYFHVPTDEDDPDTLAGRREKEPVKLATEEEVTLVNTLVTLTGADKTTILTYYKVDNFSKLTSEQIQQVIRKQKKTCTEKNIPFEEVK